MREVFKSIFLLPGNKGYRCWALRRAIGWQIWKRAVGRPLPVQLANGLRIQAYPGCVESSAAVYVRWPDRLEIEWLRKNLTFGQKVIDVGANIGLWSLLLADVVGRENLTAVEPGRTAAARLKQNFLLNRISEEQIHEIALGDCEKEVLFPDSNSPETTASLLAKKSAAGCRLVRQTTLDLFDPKIRPGSVGLLKIDVEGYESQVLKGGIEFLCKIRPKIICFESFGNVSLAECREALESCGYKIALPGMPETPLSSPQNHFAFPRKEN